MMNSFESTRRQLSFWIVVTNCWIPRVGNTLVSNNY
jgi:hypothetical protein